VDWKPLIRSALRYSAVALCSAGMVGWLRAISIWYQYWDLPHSPVPGTGNIYPLSIHGYVVYQTFQKQLYRQRWEFWSIAVAGFGAALGAVHKWMCGKAGGQGG
jgi:hypothetical protein